MSISWGEEMVHAGISGCGDELEDTEGGCRALAPFFFLFSVCDPLYFGSCGRDQTPAGRLLLSQMSGMHGKMQLVLSTQEARQANCAITHCADQQESPGRSSVDE